MIAREVGVLQLDAHGASIGGGTFRLVCLTVHQGETMFDVVHYLHF